MNRLPLLLLLACASIDITQPISNAPDLLTFLRNPHGCFTPCGVHVLEGDCEAAQRFEGRALAKLAPVGGWDAGTICADLSGYTVKLHRHDLFADSACSRGAWLVDRADGCDADGGPCCVTGLTEIAEKTISVASTSWDHSSLAHELVHVADRVRPGHCPWTPRLQLELYELAHHVDGSEPAPECDAGVH